ncbi:hypothetical protein HGRIS_005118 [Hohenbuehelia grisea]|uniref:FAD-binding domain-containing protein n=1 Tax=Hohenbuehelia grisea TaxID=104357 RepID=A0ABR3JEV9_9AGAR
MLRPTEYEKKWNFGLAGPQLDRDAIESNRDELVKTLKRITGRTDVKWGQVTWVSRYRPNIRMVDRFGSGRVFVAGDAAHIHSPAGGQARGFAFVCCTPIY